METFVEFIDKKGRQAKKQLKIVKKMLETNGLQVKDFLGDTDPYIFVMTPSRGLSFQGIRVYKIGDGLAYKVQREDRTHPYGKAYLLDIEEMFSDFMSENIKQDEAGKKVIECVVNEVKDFFTKSLNAERDVERGDFDTMGDPLDRTMVQSTGTDYANKLNSGGFGSSASR